MKIKYLEIAALLSAAIVDEMGSLRCEETYPQHNADEMDDYLKLQREKIRNLHASRMHVEAIAAGYAGGDDDKPEPKQEPMPNAADLDAVADEIVADMFRHGIKVMKVDLNEFFKEERAKAPPSENKAQSAAFAAGQRAAADVSQAAASQAAANTVAAANAKFVGE